METKHVIAIIGLFVVSALFGINAGLQCNHTEDTDDIEIEIIPKVTAERPLYNMYEYRPHPDTVYLTTGDLHYV